ncbi:MAG: transglutaminaseTgpA domain-containing protein [Phycisphaeraceae bacterium]
MLPNGRRLLFIQVMLAVFALCLALSNPLLLAIAGSVAVAGWLLFERVQQRRLPGWVVSTGGVCAFGMLVVENMVLGHRMVLAMAHFTLVLQALLLFGHKRPRDIIAMLVISLVQMIIACVVSVSMVFGVLMLAYCFLLTWTLSRLQMETAYVGLASSPKVTRRGGVPMRRTPVGLRVTRAVIGVLCLLVGLLCFLLVPRSDSGAFVDDFGGVMLEQATGYSERVDVRTSPSLEGSDEAVLRLRVTAHGEPFRGTGQVYLLRGMVFDQYDVASGQWMRGVEAQARYQHVPLEMGSVRFVSVEEPMSLLEGEVTIRRRNHEALFSVLPVVSFTSANVERLEFNPLDQVLRTSGAGTPGGALGYTVRWPLFHQMEIPGVYFDAMEGREGLGMTRSLMSDRHVDRYARGWLVDEGLIRAYTMAILEREGLERDPELAFTVEDWKVATRLAQELRDHYRYRRFNPRPRGGVDPVTAFLLDHRTGHCELFASGLAAMCRSVGIPARLIVGYRVSEYNEAGSYYVARQKHAHAWVEVATDADGGWRSLDGTPHSSIEVLHATEDTLAHRLRSWYERLEFSWIASIVAYDDHARNLLVAWAQNVPMAAEDIAGVLRRVWGRTALWFSAMTGSSLALWGGLVATGLGALLAGVAVLLARHKRDLERLGVELEGWSEGWSWVRRMDFYLRMIRLLERHGYVRPSWQTPQAFAEELMEANPMRFGPVVSLTALFYRARFGGEQPDEGEMTLARAHLEALRHGLATGASRL